MWQGDLDRSSLRVIYYPVDVYGWLWDGRDESWCIIDGPLSHTVMYLCPIRGRLLLLYTRVENRVRTWYESPDKNFVPSIIKHCCWIPLALRVSMHIGTPQCILLNHDRSQFVLFQLGSHKLKPSLAQCRFWNLLSGWVKFNRLNLLHTNAALRKPVRKH